MNVPIVEMGNMDSGNKPRIDFFNRNGVINSGGAP
jgi:hypothetical protein